MKKLSTIVLNVLLLAILLPSMIFSQDRGEVIVVPPVYEGSAFGVLNRFIMGDTIAGGERAHPNAIYRLQRGQYYEVNSKMVIDFNITIDAEAETNPASPTRPPMIIVGKDDQGNKINPIFDFIGDSTYIEFKGVIINAFDPTGPLTEQPGRWGMYFYGAFHRFSMDSCIVLGYEAAVTNPRATDRCSYFYTNNIFYNNLWIHGVGGGGVMSNTVKTAYNDSVVIVNNTFFNMGGNVFLDWEFVDYYEYSHNTMYNTSINGLWLPNFTNAKFNDNLFVDYQTVGETEWEYHSGHWDKGTPRHGHASILKLNLCDPQILADHRMEESDRKVEAKNNVYYWSETLRDYWENETSQKDINMGNTGEIYPTTWINSMTDSMFKSLGDYQYPHLVQENNVNLDPGFDAQMVSDVLAKEIPFVQEYRKYGWTTLDDAVERYYYKDGTGAELFNVPWPLNWSLAYTNEAVLTHAQGGFPAGDLNWFPDKKAEWEEWVSDIEIENNYNNNMPRNYNLSQNYPNPFNPTTEINFSIPKSGLTSLEVYNLLGQKVATLVNKQLAAGSYKYKFDGSNLASGVYFYKLQANDYAKVKKMMLMK